MIAGRVGWPLLCAAGGPRPRARRAGAVAPVGRARRAARRRRRRATPSRAAASATPFTLRLPSGAECPGDSADDDYRVNSYMVPDSVDPLEVAYDGLGPTPNQARAGRRVPPAALRRQHDLLREHPDGRTTENRATRASIQELPLFDFDVFTPGDVPAGRYHVGIACTLAQRDRAPVEHRDRRRGGRPPTSPPASAGRRRVRRAADESELARHPHRGRRSRSPASWSSSCSYAAARRPGDPHGGTHDHPPPAVHRAPRRPPPESGCSARR